MKEFWWCVLFSLVLCLMPQAVSAEQDPGLQVSALIEEALQNNPRIAAAQFEWAASKAHVGQMNVLDDPIVGFDTWNIPNDLDLDKTQTWIVFAEQRFPAPGTLALREAVAEAEALQAKAKMDVTKQVITREVKLAYAALFLAHKTIEVTNNHIAVLKRFEEAAAMKFSTGTVSRQDLLKAQVALARLNNDRILQEQALETASAALNTLLNRPVRAPFEKVARLKSPVLLETPEQLESTAFDQQATLKLSAVSIKRHEQSVALAKKKLSPDFQVGVKRFENKGSSQANGWGVSASMNLPWFFREKHDQGIAEGHHQAAREAAYYEYLKNQTRFAIQNLSVKIQTAARLVRLFEEEVIPRAEQSVASADAGYQSDQVDFLDLLESESQLLSFRLEYYQAMTDQYQQSARLEQVLGVSLDDLQQNRDGGKK